MSTADREIHVQNIRPIEDWRVTLPEKGVLELRAVIGGGKSTMLEVIETLLGRRKPGELPIRRGALVGRASGLGREIVITAGRRPSVRGELEITGIASGADPSRFIDPRVKDPKGADAERLREAIRIAEIEITDAEWKAALGEHWVEMENEGVAEVDPVTRWGMFKRAIEERARAAEKIVNQVEAEVALLVRQAADERERATGMAPTRPIEELLKLQGSLDAERVELSGRLSRNVNAKQRIAELRQKRAEVEAGIGEDHPTGSIHALLGQNELEIRNEQVEIDALEAALTRRQNALNTLQETRTKLNQKLKAVQDNNAALAKMRDQLKLTDAAIAEGEHAIVAVPEGRLDELNKQAAALQTELLNAREQDRIAELERRAANAAEGLKFKRRTAEDIRNTARSLENVMVMAFNKVAPEGLRFADGRIVAVDNDGADVFFEELSEGMRTKIALRMIVKAVGRGAIVAMEGWERLNPSTQALVAQEADEKEMLIVVCRPTDNEDLQAVQVKPQGQHGQPTQDDQRLP
jgi:hypothetical protein